MAASAYQVVIVHTVVATTVAITEVITLAQECAVVLLLAVESDNFFITTNIQ